MRKIFNRVIATVFAVVVGLFVAFVAVVCLHPAYVLGMGARLYEILVWVLGGLAVMLGVVNAINLFVGSDALGSVLLFKNGGCATRASVRVVKHWIRVATAQIAGVKATKIALGEDENGDVGVKLILRVRSDRSLESLVSDVQATVVGTLKTVLGLKIAEVDVALANVKRNTYLQNAKAVQTDNKLNVSTTKTKDLDSEINSYCCKAEEDAEATSDVFAELSE